MLGFGLSLMDEEKLQKQGTVTTLHVFHHKSMHLSLNMHYVLLFPEFHIYSNTSILNSLPTKKYLFSFISIKNAMWPTLFTKAVPTLLLSVNWYLPYLIKTGI